MTRLVILLLMVVALFAIITVLVDRLLPKERYAKYAPAAVAAFLAVYNLIARKWGAGQGFEDLAQFAFLLMLAAGLVGALFTALWLSRAKRK